MSSLATLARPYAKAAFDLAESAGELAAWNQWLSAAASVVSDERVSAWLNAPGLDRSKPAALCAEAAGTGADSPFTRFLGILAENDRLSLLPEVTRLFEGLRQQAERRLRVRVVSAVALDEEQSERLSAALRRRYDHDIELHNEVDAQVLGGAVIYAGGEVIDGSLRGRLERLQHSLA